MSSSRGMSRKAKRSRRARQFGTTLCPNRKAARKGHPQPLESDVANLRNRHASMVKTPAFTSKTGVLTPRLGIGAQSAVVVFGHRCQCAENEYPFPTRRYQLVHGFRIPFEKRSALRLPRAGWEE